MKYIIYTLFRVSITVLFVGLLYYLFESFVNASFDYTQWNAGESVDLDFLFQFAGIASVVLFFVYFIEELDKPTVARDTGRG